MKTAGNILSALFDERFLEKAQEYSKLHNSWAEITAKNGIAAAADHSRIKDLEKGILLVEMDHPGWKQILQTKQTQLLNDYRRRFPGLDISGISLMLSSGKPQTTDIPVEKTEIVKEPAQVIAEEPSVKGYDAIKDKAFRDKLIKLGQSIAAGELHK